MAKKSTGAPQTAAPVAADAAVNAAHRLCAALDAFRRGHGNDEAAELLAVIREIAAQ